MYEWKAEANRCIFSAYHGFQQLGWIYSVKEVSLKTYTERENHGE